MSNRDSLRINPNKENKIFGSNDTAFKNGFVGKDNIPQTPMEKLLKRTHSNTLSTNILKDNKQLNNNNFKNTKLNRLPLASKDNNNSHRSNSFILQNNKLVSNKLPLHNNNNDNSKKLRKYESILGVNNKNHGSGLHSVKSLILKDIPNKGSKEDEGHDGIDMDKIRDEDGDEDENLITLNLKKSLNSQKGSLLHLFENRKYNDENDSEEEEVGLFGNGKGLKELINSSNNKINQTEDIEDIEITSKSFNEIPYNPDGYTPLNFDDYKKLNTFTSPYSITNPTDFLDTEEHNTDGLLELEIIESSDENKDEENNPFETTNINDIKTNKQRQRGKYSNDIIIEPTYNDGLNAEELEDLLDM